MKIKTQKVDDSPIQFKDVELGAVFTYTGVGMGLNGCNLFMKSEIGALRLMDGLCFFYLPDDKVVVHDLTFIIED